MARAGDTGETEREQKHERCETSVASSHSCLQLRKAAGPRCFQGVGTHDSMNQKTARRSKGYQGEGETLAA